MVYQTFRQLTEQVRASGRKKVSVAAAQDVHTLEAVFAARAQGIVEPILVGDRAAICQIACALGHSISENNIVGTQDTAGAAAKAVALVRDGTADFLMKGALETATLMRAVLDQENGMRTGGVISHVAILEIPTYHKLLAVTDGGMIPHPTLEQKREILINAVELLDALGYDCPNVAVLTASETLNERQPETGDALALAQMASQGALPRCTVAGPISFDLAFSPEAARAKGFDNPVTGEPDILLVPEITCGNALVKSLQYLAGARMAGCVVGARAPIVLTSRSASAEEKHLSILLSAAIAGGRQ